MKDGKWYLGAMNDGLFIIDQPPQPAPTDYFCDVDHGVNVIAAMGADRAKAEAIVKAHNEVVATLSAKTQPTRPSAAEQLWAELGDEPWTWAKIQTAFAKVSGNTESLIETEQNHKGSNSDDKQSLTPQQQTDRFWDEASQKLIAKREARTGRV